MAMFRPITNPAEWKKPWTAEKLEKSGTAATAEKVPLPDGAQTARPSYDRRVAELRTERLVLRQWRDGDLEPFAALNADPETMRYFPAPIPRESSDAFAVHIRRHIDEEGWGLWAVEVAGGARFIGFVGLARPSFEAHFTPAVEVGWRLAREHWGHGYATEAGKAALRYGFEELDLDEIVSFTSPLNEPSWRVMERLGMTRDPADDFEHPRVAVGHPLRRHLLYRLPRDAWAVSGADG
jgi:RimJ/RimL family protein N-acetyltransferase